ncbi:Asp-tRNA(Asn)/Glu-tRNA(Gln) amidotransferase A subunit family amidase [Rhizobium sp. SG_E_25_P2]|uniref:amidase n=1 Tax=Rhizobium sp. SG_E_25_P2 TaxID=2879942 RepID=UPI002474EAB9|nr:amidase [Rhizobium sp. SG_E_25_P2]MDH6264851.1 Asp-tRNA(Asn)/Glu-tRNA(Gln) amidotransferase A subunit family amidase [Rhizobium sp. SG_E_25_P2]
MNKLSSPEIRALSARTLAAFVEGHSLTVTEIAEAYLERIAAHEADVQAWKYIDAEQILAQAGDIDKAGPKGALSGVAIGVKDVIDTADMPTGYGSSAYEGFQPACDAPCVALSRAEGALVLGKTVSTEFAMASSGKTRNPYNPAHTPGGSSSGSCAAVAAGMALMAFGTQTAGSIIRPASYCGVVGYKPSFGLIDAAEVKVLSHQLDTLGLITRRVDDAAWCAAALSGRSRLVVNDIPDQPVIGLFAPSRIDQAGPEAMVALEQAATRISAAGGVMKTIALPDWFDSLHDLHSAIMGWEVTHALAHERLKLWDRLTPVTRDFLTEKAKVSVEDYEAACTAIIERRAQLSALMDGLDAIMTLPAPGEAPEGLSSTGAPVFNSPWTVLHGPCVTLPVMLSAKGLPVGAQLVGRIGDDARLLHVAAFAEKAVGFTGGPFA